MRKTKLVMLMLIVFLLTSCAKPTPVINSNEMLVPEQPYEIPFGSEEYNTILENHVYGKWVVSSVLIEPLEEMDKFIQDLIIGTEVEFSQTKITNNFTDERVQLAHPYQIPVRQQGEANTEIIDFEYVVKSIDLYIFTGGGTWFRDLGSPLEFDDINNIIDIRAVNQNGAWRGLGGSIIIRSIHDENTLILAYESGFWELTRFEP
jgi:hypothetical protein